MPDVCVHIVTPLQLCVCVSVYLYMCMLPKVQTMFLQLICTACKLTYSRFFFSSVLTGSEDYEVPKGSESELGMGLPHPPGEPGHRTSPV